MACRQAGVEALDVNPDFWRGRRVLVTGHTGFKGSWLVALLDRLGARVSGYALVPPTEPALFALAGLAARCADTRGDIRDAAALRAAAVAIDPEIVFHLAAQPLVARGHAEPVETVAVNALGTAHLLDACRAVAAVRAIVVVTTDKCYAPPPPAAGYRETDRLGGDEPYAASKAAAELITAAWRASGLGRTARIATARAGNVIGGGDFAADRLVPDAMRAFAAGRPLGLRHPAATRPWIHVLDPLAGYLLLAERLAGDDGPAFEGAWNFGPDGPPVPVAEVADRLVALWRAGARWETAGAASFAEASALTLESTKARTHLDWTPRFELGEALDATVAWYRAFSAGNDVAALTRHQVEAHLAR